jgi:crotonobetainyl-CoA:carnitine CoA-transferase CaiB-like acyl-CoA transferase
MAALETDSTGRPSLVHHGLVDKSTGYAAAQAITAALLERHRTGTGSVIDLSMLDVAIGFLWPDGMMDRTVEVPERSVPPISRTFRVTQTADGYISMVTLTDRQWMGLRASVGLDAVAAGSVQERMRTGAETMREVARRISAMTTAEAITRLSDNDVPCAPVLGLEEIPAHPQVVASGTLHTSDHPVLGRITQPRLAPRWRGAVDRLDPAPTLGEHTDEILTQHGTTPERIAELRDGGVIA